jgi:transforming growth factor-beta-induced protein
MRTKLVRLFALLFAFTLIAAACGSDEPTAVADEPAAEATDDEAADDSESAPGTIVDVAVGAGDFTTLVAAVQAAGLVDTLSGEGPFTVFAPTDAAFDVALADLGVTAEELLANPDLGDILTYHVVPGVVPASDVVTLDGQEVATVNGATVAISIDGENVMVNNANVISTDIIASNGIIHVIDAVLLPPA